MLAAKRTANIRLTIKKKEIRDVIRSMTGFGRAEVTTDKRKLTVEMKSVNNRYLDFNIRMPKKFNFLEAKIRSVLKEYMVRGKVDVFISCENYGETAGVLKYNSALAAEYYHYYQMIVDQFQLEGKVHLKDIASAPEVLTLEDSDADEDALWGELEGVLRQAASAFAEARALEGERLHQDLNQKLSHLSELADEIEKREPEILADYRARLEEKMKEILEDRDLDESRIAAEVVVYADKICTDEETVRLKSHVKQMTDELNGGSGIGRKLDFLTQELNREANTILSKANDQITSNIGIELKTEIEKIREQIQNIE